MIEQFTMAGRRGEHLSILVRDRGVAREHAHILEKPGGEGFVRVALAG